jgi:tetratricopeptide (TPR) repeat protein
MISSLLSNGIKRIPIKRRNLIILPSSSLSSISTVILKRNALSSTLSSYNNSKRLYGTLEDKILKAHYLLDDALKDLTSNANSSNSLGAGAEAIVEKLKKSLQLYPTAVAHYNLGNVLFSLKQFQEAKHNWEESIKISSKSTSTNDYEEDDIKVDALVNLGNLELLVENNTKEAINLFKQALLLIKVKDDGELRFNLGVALDKNGQLSEAIKEYERSIELLSSSGKKDSSSGNKDSEEKVNHVEMVLRNAKIRNHLK